MVASAARFFSTASPAVMGGSNTLCAAALVDGVGAGRLTAAMQAGVASLCGRLMFCSIVFLSRALSFLLHLNSNQQAVENVFRWLNTSVKDGVAEFLSVGGGCDNTRNTHSDKRELPFHLTS